MELRNFYERNLWNEWTKRMMVLSKRDNRNRYFPHNMDSYYELETNMVSMRREHMQKAKSMFDTLNDPIVRTRDDHQYWIALCMSINKHDEQFSQMIKTNNTKAFFDELHVLENDRLQTMYEKLEQQHAAKLLLQLRNEIVEKVKRTVTNKKRTDTIQERKTLEPVRRSGRIQQKRKRELMNQIE